MNHQFIYDKEKSVNVYKNIKVKIYYLTVNKSLIIIEQTNYLKTLLDYAKAHQ